MKRCVNTVFTASDGGQVAVTLWEDGEVSVITRARRTDQWSAPLDFESGDRTWDRLVK